MLINCGCSEDLVMDFYDHAFEAYLYKIKHDSVRSPKTYILKTTYYLWKLAHKESKRFILIDDREKFDDYVKPSDESFLEENLDLMKRCIEKLDKKCRNLLRYKLRGFANESIAYRMNYDKQKKVSDDSRYCLRKLNDEIVKEINRIYNGSRKV